eukprot:4091293-Pyramimonas_sp.AAC.1
MLFCRCDGTTEESCGKNLGARLQHAWHCAKQGGRQRPHRSVIKTLKKADGPGKLRRGRRAPRPG